MRTIARFALIVAAALSLFARMSNAQAIPAASAKALLVANFFTNAPPHYVGYPPVPIGVTTSGSSDGYSAQVSPSLQGSPSISVVASTTTGGPGDASAAGELDYYFEVEGPGPEGSEVPVDISAILTTQAFGGESLAYLTLNTFGQLAGAQASDVHGFPSPPYAPPYDSVNYSGVPDLQLGVIYQVDLLAEANVSSGYGIGGSTASIDPTITIDPTFLAENPGYSIIFSEGVSKSSGMPDGGSTLALLGFAFTGVAAFRRRFAK